jgi:hypothetical protein
MFLGSLQTDSFLLAEGEGELVTGSLHNVICWFEKRSDAKRLREHFKCKLAVADSKHEGLQDLPNIGGARNVILPKVTILIACCS